MVKFQVSVSQVFDDLANHLDILTRLFEPRSQRGLLPASCCDHVHAEAVKCIYSDHVSTLEVRETCFDSISKFPNCIGIKCQKKNLASFCQFLMQDVASLGDHCRCLP